MRGDVRSVLCDRYFSTWLRVSNELSVLFFFQAEDGIRDLVRSRGLGDVYKRQGQVVDSVSLVSEHKSHRHH